MDISEKISKSLVSHSKHCVLHDRGINMYEAHGGIVPLLVRSSVSVTELHPL